MVSEFVGTMFLLAAIVGSGIMGERLAAAAYWFTSSTSFANPAVTLARAATNTFTGIRPIDTPGFILAQFLGFFAAVWLFRWILVEPVAQ